MYTLQSCRESAFLCIMLNVGHSQPSPWGLPRSRALHVALWHAHATAAFVLTMRLPTTHFALFQSYRRLKRAPSLPPMALPFTLTLTHHTDTSRAP